MNPTPEQAFLALSICFGIALGVALPPGAAPDEGAHVGRAWALAEGHLLLPGPGEPPATIPRAIPELYRAVNGTAFPPDPPRRTLAELRAVLAAPLRPGQRVRLLQSGTATPVAYAPAWCAVAFGRALGVPAGALVGLGRAANLGAWIALTWLAIRVCPLRKWTLVLLALMPTSLAAAASVSPDPVTNAAALLLVALAMRAAVGRSGPLSHGEVAALVGAGLLVGAAKAGYWPLAGAALLIPPDRCGGRARWGALFLAVAAATLAPSLAWQAAAAVGSALPPGVDVAAQLRHIASDPIRFAGVVAASAAADGLTWVHTFIGVLGLLIVPLPAFVYWAWAAALLLAVVADGPQPAALTPARRALLGAIFAACVLSTLVLAYAGWNPVGAERVRGVQGRYFIPAAPALLLALPSLPRPLPGAGRAALLAVAAAANAIAVAAVTARYYLW